MVAAVVGVTSVNTGHREDQGSATSPLRRVRG